MKSSLIVIGVTIILTLVLSYQPPLAGFSQAKLNSDEIKFNMDTTLLDSVLTYKIRLDSIKYEGEDRLNTLREQQRIISTFNKN